jgi:hypothetical protein
LSENILQKIGTGFYDREKISGREMSTSKGQLILTNRRLIFIKYQGGKKVFGLHMTLSGEDYSGRIEEGLGYEGSFEVPIEQIVEAKADYFRAGITRMFYLRIRYHSSSGEKAQSFYFIAKQSDMEFIAGEFAKNIESSRSSIAVGTAQLPQPTTSPPSAPSPTFITAPAAPAPTPQVPAPTAPHASEAASPDTLQRLQSLKKMLDSGLINQQDYDEQKKRILESM